MSNFKSRMSIRAGDDEWNAGRGMSADKRGESVSSWHRMAAFSDVS